MPNVLREENRTVCMVIQRTIPAYRDPVFHMLNEILGIVVCHSPSLAVKGKPVAGADPEIGRIAIPGRYLYGHSGPFTQAVYPVLRLHRPRVVIAQFSFRVLTFWKLLALKPFLGYKLIPWSHGLRNDLWAREDMGGRGFLSMIVYRLTDASLFYSDARRRRLLGSHAVLLRKSFVANNTLDTLSLEKERKRVLKNGMDVCREHLGLHAPHNLIYIGRLLPDKRLDLLINAWKILRTRIGIGLIIIGDGPDRVRFKEIDGYENVVLTGGVHDIARTSEYLACADLMVMPGYVGLGIVHGFAFGLPMITCRSTKTGPFHSPEIEYLRDGYNGFFCDSTPESLAACIEKLILDPEQLARMKENALETVRTEANVERMVEGFRAAITYVQEH